MSQPVSVGDEREVEIVDVGEEGDPLAFTDEGLVVFLDAGEVGDVVTVEIDRVARSAAFGSVVGAAIGDSDTDVGYDEDTETALSEDADHKYDVGDALSG